MRIITLVALCFIIFSAPQAEARLFGLFGSDVNPLLKAAENGNLDAVKQLIAQGPNINSIDASGNTALMKAAEGGHTDIVKMLIKNGANVNAVDKNGRSALHYAAKNKSSQIAKLLVDNGANVNLADKFGMTPLKQAIAYKDVNLISAIDPKALTIVQTEAVFPAVAAAAAVGGGGLSTTTMVVAGGAAAAGGVAAAAGGGGGGGGGGSSSSGGSGTPPPPPPPGGGSGGATPAPSSADFETSEYNYTISIGGNTYSQYNLRNIHASDAYFRGYTGSGVTVAVLDTGVDANHIDLNGGKTLTGIDLVNNDSNASDDNGHGTHVAGIIAAKKNGIAMHGVAYDATILPVKVLNASGGGTEATVAKGIDYVANNGIYNAAGTKAMVINMSLGSAGAMPDVKTSIINALQKNIFIAAASGNLLEGDNVGVLAQPIYPAYYASQADVNITDAAYDLLVSQSKDYGAILAVAATDSNNSIAAFSHKCGDAKQWCISAPGTLIISSWPNQSVAVSSGTSMAAPNVAGAAALLMGNSSGLSGREAAEILLITANRSFVGYEENTYGQGVLDLEKATRPLGSTSIPLGNSIGGALVPLGGSSIVTSSAFGDAISSAGLQLSILDSYNRSYNISLASLTNTQDAFADFDKTFRDFGDSLGHNTVQLSEDTSFAFENVEGTVSDTPENDGNDFARMSFKTSMDNTDIAFNYNVPMDKAFQSSALEGNSYNIGNVGHNSFLSLIEKGSSYSTGFNMDNHSKIRLGSFYGEDDGSTTFGFVNDLTHNFDKANIGLQFGMMNEEKTFLGSKSSGAFSLADNTPTWFSNISGIMPLGGNFALSGEYSLGVSYPQIGGQSLFTDISQIQSSAFNIAISKAATFHRGDNISFRLSQPLRADSGDARVSLSSGRDMDGNIYRNLYDVDLSPSGREIDLGAFYSLAADKRTSFDLGAIYRLQPGHNKDAAPDSVVMAKYNYGF